MKVVQRDFFSTRWFVPELFANSEFQQCWQKPQRFRDYVLHYYKNDPHHSAVVAKCQFAHKSCVIKYYQARNFWHGLKLKCRPSKARLSWHNAIQLSQHNIATAKPLALYERRWGIFFGEAFFCCEYLEGVNAAQLFAASVLDPAMQRAARAIITLLEQLYDGGYAHPDLSFANFLIHQDKAFLIDVDYLQYFPQGKSRFKKHWQRSIKLFAHYASQLPAAQDYFAVLLENSRIFKCR